MKFIFIGLVFFGLSIAPGMAEEGTAAPLHTRMMQMLPTAKVWELINNDDSKAPKNWWGLRGDLQEKGVTFDFVYTSDTAFNVAGGLKRGSAYMDELDLSITLDTQKMKLWNGGTFYIYGAVNGGNEKLTGKFTGDLQTVSNIETPRSTHLTELWYQQLLFEDKISVLLGMYDVNSEFDTFEYGSFFINSSFSLQPTMSANFTAPWFPLGSAAVRVKVKPIEDLEILTAVFDGDPGSIEDGNPHGLDFTINKKGGLLNINEVDYHFKLPNYQGGSNPLPGTVKVGGWYLGRNFDDVADVDENGNPVPHDGNWGIYSIIDQMVYREKESQGLGLFLQVSGVPSDRNTVTRYTGFGANYKGLIPERDNDTFGVGYGMAFVGDHARSVTNQESAEKVLELTYLIQITPAVSLQPDVQFITNPSADETIHNATVVMLRGSVSF